MNNTFRSLKEPVRAEQFKVLVPTLALGIQCLVVTLALFAPHAYLEYKFANILIGEIITFVLVLLQINPVAVSVTSSVLMFLLFYLNEYVIASRGRPLNFLDVYCIDDALKVASQYPLIINAKTALLFLLTAAVTAVSCAVIKKFSPEKGKRRYVRVLFPGIAFAVSAFFFIYYTVTGFFAAEKLVWNEETYIRGLGLLYGVFAEYQNSIVKAPEGYSIAAADAISEEFSLKKEPVSETEPPVNIIMIMNEAFADFSLIGEPDLSADPLSGIHSLNDNIAKGRLAVNIYGSSTCNTEFESITGLPLAFLPKNTMPFVQYQLEPSLSMAWDFTDMGYSCTPLHGYLGAEYRRDRIYSGWFENEFISAEKFTGEVVQDSDYNIFDMDRNFTSIPTFGDDLTYINRFISDADCYQKIEEVMKADNAEGKKSFTFTVTIQNHGAYTFNPDYEQIEFAGSDRDNTNNYLTLLSISDKAFMDFLDRLREYPERTVVIMFGDHQPYIYFNYYKSRFSEGGNPYQEISDDYIVPYIVWANYDIDWDLPEIMSANYLLTAVKASCGIELTPMDKLRYEAMEQYPVITWNFAMDSAGNFLSPDEPLSSEIMKKYNIIEYCKLFDSDK